MIFGRFGMLAVGLAIAAPSHAQSGGFVLVRGVAVDGARVASTGFGAIDTSRTTSEEALFLEGSRSGFDWRLRAQAIGNVRDFPGSASIRISTLSYGRGITETVHLSIGKQQRLWGAGVAYQPLGFFRTQTNLRDPTDAEGRAEGLPMIHVTRLGETLTLEGILSDDLRRQRRGEPPLRQWAVRASSQIGKIDGSLILRQRLGSPPGIGASATWAGEAVSAYGDFYFGPPERRREAGGDAAIAPEDGMPVLPRRAQGRRASSAIGVTFTPAAQLSLTAEWQHRGEGLSDADWREVVAGLTGAAARLRSPDAAAAYLQLARTLPLLSSSGARRDYLFGRAAFTASRISLGLNATMGLADGSAAITATCGYSVAPRLLLSAAGTRFVGGPTSEFGLSPVRGVISLALRRSFDF